MTEQEFWNLIEEAWQQTSPNLAVRRDEIAYTSVEIKNESELGLKLASIVDDKIVEYLTNKLRQVSQSELKEFDKILEQKLYDIDREDILEFTEDSDDGFLYCRGFILGMGESYYNKVKQDPSFASAYLEAESFCYFAWHLYEELYGKYPETEISRETGSNPEGGWD